jgi:hypothetical protein
MKKIITNIQDFLSGVVDWLEWQLRRLYGKPTMMKQFIVVLVLGSFLSVFSIYSLVHSIYSIGKRDARKEFIELQHIERLKLQSENDSIKQLKVEN